MTLKDYFNKFTVLKPNTAYAVKTLEGKWYTVYTLNTLNKVLDSGDFEKICIRRIA
jgi:hypothetical protein